MIDKPLAVYNGEPVSSLIGAMHFPDDPNKAELFASWWLGQRVAERGDSALLSAIPPQELRTLLWRSGRFHEIAGEAQKARYAGTQQ